MAASQEAAPENWQVACADNTCVASATSQVSRGFSLLVYEIDATPVIEIITPLGISLQTGVRLLVDQKQSFPTKLLSCELDGCRAFSTLSPALLASLKRGLSLEIVVETSKSRETLAFKFSLNGFTKAFEKI